MSSIMLSVDSLCFSAFIGPLGGGYLQGVLGFEMAAVVFGSCSLFAVSSSDINSDLI